MTTEFRPSPDNRLPNSDVNNASHSEKHNTNGAGYATSGSSAVDMEMKATQARQIASSYPDAGHSQDFQSYVHLTKPSKNKVLQWFSNLSVGRKQLAGLFTSEAISVLGLVGVGTFLIVSGGRSQLLNQTRSELSVTQAGYVAKINQMGLGFRGQSDSRGIIDVATADAQGTTITPTALENARRVLQNEITARQIEYATLVGTDKQIIVSANADRRGETFDPGGLVGTVLQNPRQVKVSAIVSWEELQNEQPPLPEGFEGGDALIRYTFTPVTADNSEEVVGILVSGDIVNEKRAIPFDTLSSFGNGYSAVYQYQEDEGFTLATSMYAEDNPDLEEAVTGVPLGNTDLLEQAIANPDEAVTGRQDIADNTYTVAAEVITDFNQRPVAVIVRGTSEAPLNALLLNSLKLQLLVAAIALIANIFLAQLLRNSITKPLKSLQQSAWKFGLGDRQARAEVYSTDEVGRVAQIFNQLADSISQSENLLKGQAEREKIIAERANLITDITSRIRQSLDEEEILSTSVNSLRDMLKSDRVLIYKFNPDLKSGEITAESVGRGWPQAMGKDLEDPMTPEALERYYTGRVSSMANRDQSNLSQCHCEILDDLEVKANMVAPLLAGEDLIGLLCVHQCSGPRHWEPEELELIQQVAIQIGYALNQARSVTQQRLTANRERQLADIITHIRENLDAQQIYQIVVKEAREALKTNRAVVYLFDENWKGTIVAESVESAYPSALGDDIYDPCFKENYIEQYLQGRVQATGNIAEAGLTECHLQQLEPYQVKANLVAPIIVEGELLGLLITHQCSSPRNWSQLDINFFRQVAMQLGYALEQAQLFTRTEALAEERRQKQESIQMQLVELLSDVEGASEGDLTVRADVTAGEIGTVADFFNAIVESLRQIVTQVKQSAEEVNSSLGENKASIQALAEDSLRQAEEVTSTLSSVERMTNSIQQVADSAQQAAEVANAASSTAETSGQAMDLTVRNILGLRDIIGETSKKVKRLGESSQQISKVVSLINQIAMQTNLLAINAGIEAARAGEEGQGFAVVAEEVGELAARSADATQEIERIVETIQRETVEVVEAMEQSTTEVVAGTHLVEDAKQNLTRILDVSQQIDQLVNSISETTISQVEVSETVTKLMQEIAKVSERTSDSSIQISTSLQRTVEVAQTLQESVSAFKTGEQ
ncbi:methyl-accepting chemotaxis protein [Oscillatoria sp. CS-180]|uniref:GAF domain-containing protein n=1 Tax=Oscillatoria sp. CS-180 TaxID=3021720 RepID=UPI00232AC18D|nr:GAF domain-containing protein [Oscillatoria sp. CS-180]MDB9526334.1 methyl-accepting chemotaxis protein [Oscillatoria sp. CS-180]